MNNYKLIHIFIFYKNEIKILKNLMYFYNITYIKKYKKNKNFFFYKSEKKKNILKWYFRM